MAVSVLITNTTASPLALPELYLTLGAAGASTDSITITRSVAELDSMASLKALLDDGDVTVVPTQSSGATDLLTLPLEQHGLETGIDVSSVALVVTAVTYPEPYPSGVVPIVTVTLDKTNGVDARGEVWVKAVTNLGFDVVYNVTTLHAASTNDANWVATY